MRITWTLKAPSNKELANRILDCGGCILSEYPENTKPERYSYVQRDRLQSGLSSGVIIIEADEKSGTMHTARFALSQSRRRACYYSALLKNCSGNKKLIDSNKASSLLEDSDVYDFLKEIKNQVEYQQLSLF